MTRWTERSGFCGICRNTVYTEKGSFNRHCADHHPGALVSFVRVPVGDCQAVQDAMKLGQALPARYGGAPVAVVVPAAVAPPAAVVSPAVVSSAAAPAPPSLLPSGYATGSLPPSFVWPSIQNHFGRSATDVLRHQIRPSRSTRNQDHQAASRSRGVVDLDPTEGLPVQGWEQVTVKVNQDPSSDQAATLGAPSGVMSTTSPEWAAQFNTEQFPWPEKPLPSFFSQLPLHNQEMIRRARCPNTNPTISIYDPKTNSYISGIDAEKRARANQMKSIHLNNLGPSSSTNDNNNAATSGPTANDDSNDQDDEDDNEDQHDDDVDDDDEHTEPTSRNIKRRKYVPPEDRTFSVKRWVQVPQAVAEKSEERKFLADRRPGMASLYGTSLQNEVFGQIGLTSQGYTTYGTSNAAYDLGDGAGLSSALGGGAEEPGPAAAPVRRNMPPKRKKKKGGPGRRKAVPATDANGMTTQTGTVITGDDVQMIDQDPDQAGDSGGDSEGEGSEDGELNEENLLPGAERPQQDAANLDVTAPITESMVIDEPAALQEEGQVSTIAASSAITSPAEVSTQTPQPAFELGLEGVTETATEHEPQATVVETASLDQAPAIPEPVIEPIPAPESIPAPVTILEQPLTLSSVSAMAGEPVVQTVTDPDTHELVSEPIHPVDPTPNISDSITATPDAGTTIPEPDMDMSDVVPPEPVPEIEAAPVPESAPMATSEPLAQSDVTPAAAVVDTPATESSVAGPGQAQEKIVEPVTESTEDAPMDVSTTAPAAPVSASTAAPITASTEIDLLGGLEDQLDRDMAS